MCISPISIVDPKGSSRAQRITVPCGRCLECLSRRRNDWSLRLSQELKRAESAFFITLTYDDEHIPYVNGSPAVVKKDVQDWLKRYRKLIAPTKVRYFLVSEYGATTLRPHYHLLLFNAPTKNLEEDVASTWQKGHIHVGTVTAESIHYCTKYCLVLDGVTYPEELKPFMLCSQGIGINYITDAIVEYHNERESDEVTLYGHKHKLPRYYKDKIFSDDLRASIGEDNRKAMQLSSMKLDEKYGVVKADRLKREAYINKQIILKRNSKKHKL